MQVYKCTWCGTHLLQEGDIRQPRSDKRFCCAAHRVKFHRWLKNLNALMVKMSHDIDEMTKYLDHPQAREQAAKHLSTARQHIDHNLADAGVRRVR